MKAYYTGNWKWNSEFYKKEELESPIYTFKPIEDVKLRRTEYKKKGIAVSESKILIDAKILFQSLCDMRTKGPRQDGQYWTSSVMQKKLYKGEGLLTYVHE